MTRTGVKGEKLVRYRVRYEDGKPVKRTAIGTEVVTKPVNKVVSIGSRGRYTSRGEFRTRKVAQDVGSGLRSGPEKLRKIRHRQNSAADCEPATAWWRLIRGSFRWAPSSISRAMATPSPETGQRHQRQPNRPGLQHLSRKPCASAAGA